MSPQEAYNHQKIHQRKGKFVTFSRENVNPTYSAPLYMNDKIYPISMECTKDKENGGRFQMCKFSDRHNREIMIRRVSFITNQASHQRVTAYPHPQGDVITRIEFPDGDVVCEFFGLIETGLTISCKDATDKPIKNNGAFTSF